jgi:hypothetical protein
MIILKRFVCDGVCSIRTGINDWLGEDGNELSVFIKGGKIIIDHQRLTEVYTTRLGI